MADSTQPQGSSTIRLSTRVLIGVCLAVGTFVTYLPAANYDFVNYDDPEHVTSNPHVETGLTGENLRWAWTIGTFANWHPLTFMSHMVDVELFGDDAGGHHLTSLLFHSANAALLFLVFYHMTRALGPSVFVAVLFALHPLHVESVAWVAERKDVLSTFFWLLTLLAYARYVAKGGALPYLLVVAMLAMGLLSKPMVITLPFVLLLLDIWPLKRVDIEGDLDKKARKQIAFLLLEKAPLFLMVAALSIITFIVQDKVGVVASSDLSARVRIANAALAYVTYMSRMVWPIDLAVYYPHPGADIPALKASVSILFLTAISAAILWKLPSRPYLAVGWFWYLGTLVPVIGLIQVGSQAMADRYTYIPLIGLFVIVAWGCRDTARLFRLNERWLAAPALLIIAALFVATRQQMAVWHDSESLWKQAIAATENNATAYYNLGKHYFETGNPEAAEGHFLKAVSIDPYDVEAHTNLGIIFQEREDLYRAKAHLSKALLVKPDDLRANVRLGRLLIQEGDYAGAATCLRRALDQDEGSAKSHTILAIALASSSQIEEAVEHLNRALELDPSFVSARYNLGVAMAKRGDFPAAVKHFLDVLKEKPDDVDARLNLAYAYRQLARPDEARNELLKLLEREPEHGEALEILNGLDNG